MNKIRCPRCGESYYMERYTTCTAVYYPPVYKNCININPDQNLSSTTCKCLNCGHNFVYQLRGSEIYEG